MTDIQKIRVALERLARLGNGERYGNSDGNIIAQEVLHLIRRLEEQENCETVTVQEAWDWAGGNPDYKPSRQDLKFALETMDAIVDTAHDSSSRCISARNNLNEILYGEGALIDSLEEAVESVRRRLLRNK